MNVILDGYKSIRNKIDGSYIIIKLQINSQDTDLDKEDVVDMNSATFYACKAMPIAMYNFDFSPSNKISVHGEFFEYKLNKMLCEQKLESFGGDYMQKIQFCLTKESARYDLPPPIHYIGEWVSYFPNGRIDEKTIYKTTHEWETARYFLNGDLRSIIIMKMHKYDKYWYEKKYKEHYIKITNYFEGKIIKTRTYGTE